MIIIFGILVLIFCWYLNYQVKKIPPETKIEETPSEIIESIELKKPPFLKE